MNNVLCRVQIPISIGQLGNISSSTTDRSPLGSKYIYISKTKHKTEKM